MFIDDFRIHSHLQLERSGYVLFLFNFSFALDNRLPCKSQGLFTAQSKWKRTKTTRALHDTAQFNTKMIVLIWECQIFRVNWNRCYFVLPLFKGGESKWLAIKKQRVNFAVTFLFNAAKSTLDYIHPFI